MRNQAVILQAQRIFILPAAVAVALAAGLRTAAPVTGTAADSSRQVALSGIAHAQCAVAKDLDLNRACLADGCDLFPSQLPAEDYPGHTPGRAHQNAGQGVDRHLGRAVDRHIGSNGPAKLHHSQILRYQATGLYPVKLTQEDGYDASLQLILSTRDDLAAVELTSPLKDQADFKLSQSVIGAGGPSMLVFACPDDLMLNTMNIQYLYDWNNTPNTNPLAPELGHYGLTTDTDSDPSHASFVSLNLQEDNVFTFTYDPLSSYFNYGHYTIQGDRLIAVTDDGRHQYCFQILGKYTLRFLQDQSSEVSLIDERFGSAVTDGALFQHPLYYFGGNIN